MSEKPAQESGNLSSSQPGVLKKYSAKSYDIYTKELVQTHVGPVLTASVSVRSCTPCLVDSEGLVLMPSLPSGSYTLSTSSSARFPRF